MIVWLKSTLGIVGSLILLILLIKFITYKMNNNSFDSRLNGIRSRFSSVCDKISNLIGC